MGLGDEFPGALLDPGNEFIYGFFYKAAGVAEAVYDVDGVVRRLIDGAFVDSHEGASETQLVGGVFEVKFEPKGHFRSAF